MGAPDLSDSGDWLDRLERRHLAELTFREVRRGVQALSGWYVESRNRRRSADVFGGAGKRAAFGLFFTPLHALTVRAVGGELGAGEPPPNLIVDLGCGAGAAGAGWALGCSRRPDLLGADRSPWALGEARWNWRILGLRCRTLAADVNRVDLPGAGGAVVAGWTVNELDDAARDALLERLLAASGRGARVLVVEPIARRLVPWWGAWQRAFEAAGGRADEWRFRSVLPDIVARLDRAAGLDHREQTARSLYLPGR